MYIDLHKGRHKPLYTHFTCATDTENIRIVFKSVKDTLFQENLDKFGLVWDKNQVMDFTFSNTKVQIQHILQYFKTDALDFCSVLDNVVLLQY